VLVEEHVNSSFGLLFADAAAAARYLGESVAPAPLGCISKRKESGELKHRVIMDLKSNQVNQACSTPERQVLPTVFSHARDLAILSQSLCSTSSADSRSMLQTMVLDFKDAFMSIPLDKREWSVNCCQLSDDIVLKRRPLIESEPRRGRFVLWTVLGFGGKPNPLVFSRVASFAARTAQGLLRPTPQAQGHPRASPGRVQLYVDDPTVSVAGTARSNALAIDLVALWWLSLGIPLAWRNGSWSDNLHRWIGADFVHRAAGQEFVAVVSVPPAFAEELLQMLRPIARGRGCTADAALEVILGKAGRLAYILPATRPFVAALWGARAGSTSANSERKRREAPPGQHANKRFASAARWLCTLLSPPGPADALLPLETVVAK